MPSNFSSLQVIVYDQSNAYAGSTDITDDIKSIPLFTDTGTGEVNQATIVVRSLDGKYNTDGAYIFEEFDRIHIEVTDLGGNTYSRYFEIINILPGQTKMGGNTIELECLGIEYHTQHIHFAKPYYFEDSYTVGTSIGDIYNQNRGTEQPALTNHDVVYSEGNGYGSALPFFNANNWEFGLNEDSCYNRWMDLLEGAGAAVSAGGALTFYEMNFDTIGVNSMDFKMRKSGDNSTIIQVLNSVATGVKVGEQEAMISNPTGTNLLAWGSNEHGTLPVDNSKYYSKLLQFIFRPEWGTSIVYEVDARVKVTPDTAVAPKHYKCDEAHTSGTFATDLAAGKWSQIDQSDEFGDTIQYSPWTDDKATVWSNNGADPARSTFTNGAWFDINVVVNEEDYFRTWVDAIATTNAELDTLAARYSYTGTRSNFPRGFRVLVNDDSPTGVLANFANMVVSLEPTNSTGATTWRKLYNFTSDHDDAQVAVLDEGKVYEYDHSSTSWSDISGDDWANDCFHKYTTAPANVDGQDLVGGTTRSEITDNTNRPDITSDGSEFSTNQESAIQFKSAVGSLLTAIATSGSTPTGDYYGSTIGFNFRFPYPITTDNSISEEVGELYGGGAPEWATSTSYSVGDKVYEGEDLYNCIVAHTSGTFATDKAAGNWTTLIGAEPATLDIQNMNYTHDGQEGFNTTNSACEDYGQISAVAMWMRYSVVDAVTSNELNDEHRFRAWMIDTKDNVVYQDFVIRFSNNWEDIRLPVSGFRIYKGRKPIDGIIGSHSLVPPKELETINIFEWRNIKLFGVQLQSQYDKFGRYNPGAATVDEAGNSVTWSNIDGATRTLDIDGFRFIKPLLVTSGRDATRNLEPDFQQLPNITVYDQLLNAAKSHLEIEKFKHKEFNIESSGDEIFDIPFGDSFYLKNEDLVSDDDKAGENNNIKLVAKRIEYSITKNTGGKGGLRRKINGSKVFT